MATAAPNKDAAKVAKLREMAKDKSLPQDVRNTYLDEATKLEEKAAKGAGVKLAKGGAVKKMMYGGMADKPMMAMGGDAKKKMMMGGAVAKELPMRGQRTATNKAKKMAMGGDVQMAKEAQMVKPNPMVKSNPMATQMAARQKESMAIKERMQKIRQDIGPLKGKPTPKVSPMMASPAAASTPRQPLTAVMPTGGRPANTPQPSAEQIALMNAQKAAAMKDKQQMMAKGGAVKKAKK